MEILPRHVICVLGRWDDFSQVEAVTKMFPHGFALDREYSQLAGDDRMLRAFEASMNRTEPPMTTDELADIRDHTAVAYILSPPLTRQSAEEISAQSLLLIAVLLKQGGVAAKSESAGLAHGRARWIDLASRFLTNKDQDPHTAAVALHTAWVQPIIHDEDSQTYYSCGMHLLGHPDTEIEDSIDAADALEWIELLGLYLVADKPDRPLNDGEGFRLSDEGPRRIIRHIPCERYASDDFFYNPYGYLRLDPPA